jgi:NAD(P)-dependent dehydrogenase (short-subunit alcohol dehydrogenase family)
MSRVAVVTGGASGIGLGVARHLAADGHSVAVVDQNGDAAERAAAELRAGGASALAATVDVTDRAAIDAALDSVHTELGAVGIMVTCAGIESFDEIGEITPDTWDRIIAVNLTGTFLCIQAVVPEMLTAKWGRVVTISSSSAQSGAPRMAHYVASKAGVIGLTKALAVDLAPHGITVNTIPPSIIDTPMARHAEARGLVNIDAVAGMTPVRRAGTPDDIGATCAFLCSDQAGFITGQQIGVNGGWYL